MKRAAFKHDGLTLSYLDSGGAGPLIVTLHAMWMEARSFEPFAQALPKWRVVSLDQRGHGLSDHSTDYSRKAFVGDIRALLDHLKVTKPVVLVGNSLGGSNAFIFAAKHPKRVRALVIEESPPVGDGSFDFVLVWRGLFPTREALEKKIGERLAWSVAPSFRETARGWTLAFDPADLVAIKKVLNGDYWRDWLATTCPALVVRGTESRAVDGKVLQAMADRRPNTKLLSLKAGHVVHHDAAGKFNTAVKRFIEKLD
jgi:pimeloyl-ACP methyl ester carboxylesterase